MQKAVLLLTLLTAACIHDDGRGTMSSGGSTAIEVAPDVAKGALTLAAVGVAVAFMYAQSR